MRHRFPALVTLLIGILSLAACGGGGGGSNSVAGASGSTTFTGTPTESLSSGVGPLSVFFDATSVQGSSPALASTTYSEPTWSASASDNEIEGGYLVVTNITDETFGTVDVVGSGIPSGTYTGGSKTVLQVGSFTNTPSVNDTLSGSTSGATAKVTYVGSDFLIIGNLAGTFSVGETLMDTTTNRTVGEYSATASGWQLKNANGSLYSGTISPSVAITEYSRACEATGFTCYTNPTFHDARFVWDFGDDANNAAWPNGVQPASTCSSTNNVPGCTNYATGGVASHLYGCASTYSNYNSTTHACTYTPTMTISYGSDSRTFTLGTITVTEPDYAYSSAGGGSTVCVSGNGNFTGCPSGATQVTNSDAYAATSAYASTASIRVLFHTGETYSESASMSFSGDKVQLGSYGTGSKPEIDTSTGGIYGAAFRMQGQHDSVYGISIKNLSTTNLGYGFALTGQYSLAYQDKTDGYLYAFSALNTYSSLVDNTITSMYAGASSSYVTLTGADYFTYTGNNADSSAGANSSHTVRIEGSTKFVLTNNSDTGTTAGKATSVITVRGNTQYGEVADNIESDYGFTVLPQNKSTSELMRDVVVERNLLLNSGIANRGTLITYRNNILKGKSGGSGYITTSYANPDVPTNTTPWGNEFYNNTIYSDTTSNVNNAFWFLNSLTSSCTATVMNNLAYFPSATGGLLVANSGACVITGASGTDGNSADYASSCTTGNCLNTDPLFTDASGSYTFTTDFTLQPGSYAEYGNTGYVGVTPTYNNATFGDPAIYADFFGKTRTSPYDMGAVNH